MTKTQLEKYGEATDLESDAFGIISRDNRNHAVKQQLILDAANARAGDRVLEVGCGSGLHTPRYAERFDLHAVDLSQSLVDSTRERAPDATVMRADAHELIYKTESFTSVVGTAILHHLHDQDKALREWCRVTANGGSIDLMEPNYLFPKDFVTAHVQPEERHKTQMAPWRLRDRLQRLVDDPGTKATAFSVTPRLYTPPWPSALHSVFDRVDAVGTQLPGVRWMGQMLQVHVEC